MTYPTVVTAVEMAAMDAAHSAVDAHGEHYPPAEAAWEFMNEEVWSETGRPAGVPESMPATFANNYHRHCAAMVAGSQFYVR